MLESKNEQVPGESCALYKITFPHEVTTLKGVFSPIVLEYRAFSWIDLQITDIHLPYLSSNHSQIVSAHSSCMGPYLVMWHYSCDRTTFIFHFFPFSWNFSFHHNCTLLFRCIFNTLSTSVLNWKWLVNLSNHLQNVSKINPSSANMEKYQWRNMPEEPFAWTMCR